MFGYCLNIILKTKIFEGYFFFSRRFVCFKKFWEVRKDIKPDVKWRTLRSSFRNSGFFISNTNVVGLSQPLRAYVRQEELDASLRLSLCALRLIKTRVAQEMKLLVKVAEIACLQDFSLFLGDPWKCLRVTLLWRVHDERGSFFIKI